MYYDRIAPLRDAEWDRWMNVPKGWRQYKHDGWGYEGYNKELYQTYRPRPDNPFRAVPASVDLAAEAEQATAHGHVGDGQGISIPRAAGRMRTRAAC